MYVKEEIDFNDLQNRCWSGAEETLQRISDEGKETELMQYLEDTFQNTEDNATDITEVNDFLRFSDDTIFADLGIEDEDEDEEDEESEEC